MTAELHRQYPAVVATAAHARDDLAAFVRAHGHDALVPVAVLMVSELATNSILHASGPITLRAQVDGRVLRVNVDDTDATLPAQRRPDGTGGRGLRIVAALATHWGAEVIDGIGKTTWFTIETDGTQNVERDRP